jgi:hypothetical protein
MDKNNNIFFLVEEKNDINDNNNDININDSIEQMMNEMLQDDIEKKKDISNYNDDILSLSLPYYIEKSAYCGEDELYYNEKYTIKELMKICQYYGISKDIKSSKCKKQDIVSTIVFFEGQSENFEIVKKRHSMWAYITELVMDTKMRSYILWN